MIVCSCRVFTDKDFAGTLQSEPPGCPRSAVEAYRCLGCGPECGRCLRTVRRILDEARASDQCQACPIDCALREGHGPHDHPVRHDFPHHDAPSPIDLQILQAAE